MRLKHLYWLGIFFIFTSCAENNSTEDKVADTIAEERDMLPLVTSLPIVENIEKATKAEAFHRKEAISFDIELYFGGKKRLDGKILSKTNSTGIRMDLKNGITLIYDGEKVVQSPANETYKSARFDIFTWQYFFLAPFKLSDPGTNWEELEEMPYNGKMANAARLTFDQNTGDAPEDWYIAYQDKESGLLDALAYIVTYGKSKEKAEAEPHAITYHDYEAVEGVQFATNWKFWMWTTEQGFFDQLGEATISNIQFVDDSEKDFSIGENAKIIEL